MSAMQNDMDRILKPDPEAWMRVARSELGECEVAGKASNPQIMQYWKAVEHEASDDSVPWCSAFVNWCMKMAGHIGTERPNARSWLEWGQILDKPTYGCIVILTRSKNPNLGHVGFFVEENKKSNAIKILGGNQQDMVSEIWFKNEGVLGYRMPIVNF